MPAQQGDALDALSYLSKLPFVDPKRIAVVGASAGGIVALELASTHDVNFFAVSDEVNFKAAVETHKEQQHEATHSRGIFH
jgi:dienelactone hydrolase